MHPWQLVAIAIVVAVVVYVVRFVREVTRPKK